ncbi:F0F1 ATP synthase subunit A [bacterium]|nr:F0F1 ATP synthase subunit A [bacterium]
MTGKKLLILAGIFFAAEILVLIVFGGIGQNAEKEGVELFRVGPVTFYRHEMGLENFQEVPRWNLDSTPEGETTFWALNKKTTVMIIIIDIFIVLMAYLATRTIRHVPGRIQNIFEIIVELFSGLIIQTLGENGKRHVPMLGSLFLFIWLSNIIGSIPLTAEPTRDLNVPIAHMLVVLFVVHFEAIRVKGLKAYLKSYNEPFFVMLPLNVIGEIAKGVSLAFRLFGNILGGAIIVTVISYLIKFTMLPVGLNLFFGIFVGTIQAFVFTMLSMTYIAVAIAD